MQVLITIIHVVVALFLIVSVLLQSGKGGGVGAAFGGTSTQVFGGHGAGGFLAKVTSVMAITFMITSFILSYMGSNNNSVVHNIPAPAPVEAQAETLSAPAAGATAPAEENKKDEAAVVESSSDAKPAEAAGDAVSDGASEA